MDISGKVNITSSNTLFIQLAFNGSVLASGTGFIGELESNFLLFTNRHNVTGRNNITNEILSPTGGIPNEIMVTFPMIKEGQNSKLIIGRSIYTFPLYIDSDESQPKWIEHVKGKSVDVIGIPLPLEINFLKQFSFPILDSYLKPNVGDRINVIGYPFGLSSDNLALWSTGYIASEMDIDYENLPVFLIDCKTRKGQSGSPVIYRKVPGENIIHKGKVYSAMVERADLLGIYSGRVNPESDLGMVWKKEVLENILTRYKKLAK